ncbi:hypothetical protein QWZ03_04765 [Chitinimonas viridis]|uniref:DUF4034 domain-containing protein n=1 Tax=Chitinimonas viridis TaxID=664880 RepID=A0ABT8B1T5_9NEIS|nr:hypothetical protein [Chitinimonas viridis]MDN3576078.1 hypothetical protein [Chitinimonas viridis]
MSLLKILRLQPYATLAKDLPTPSAKALHDKVVRGNFVDAELMFGKLSGEAREQAVYGYANLGDAVDAAAAWTKSAPRSALAHTLLGASLVIAGWKIRGSSYAEDVEQNAWRPFIEHLEAAKSALEKATELDTSAAEALAWLIHVGVGKSEDREQIDSWFEEGLRRQPTHWALHMKYFYATTEKWGGSHNEMFAYAADCSAKSPPGSMLHALVAFAYSEYALALNSGPSSASLKTLRNEKNAKALVAALYKWVGAKPGELESKLMRVSSPFSSAGLNHFGAALYLCGATDEAKIVLAAMRGEIDSVPWAWIATSMKENAAPAFVYDKACRELGLAQDW